MKKNRNKIGVYIAISLAMASLTACGDDYDGYNSYSSSKSDYSVESSVTNFSGMFQSADVSESYFDSEKLSDVLDMTSAGSGLGSSKSSTKSSNQSTKVDNGSAVNATEGRKFIRTVNLELQANTRADLEGIMRQAQYKCEELGGYVQGQSIYGNYRYTGSMTIRVPKDQTDDFLSFIDEQNYKITSTNDKLDDVTLQYADVGSRLESAKIAQEKYKEYAKQAQNIDELLQVEEKLDSVTADLESYQSQMNSLNNSIDYSTINLTIESKEASNKESFTETFNENMKYFSVHLANNLSDAIELIVNSVIYIISILPALFILITALKVIFKFKGIRSTVMDVLYRLRERRAMKQYDKAREIGPDPENTEYYDESDKSQSDTGDVQK